MFFVQTNHTRKELLFLMFKEINLRNHSSLHKLFYSLINLGIGIYSLNEIEEISVMGHSLNSDIEVIEDLLQSCLKLKKVNIFYYGEESITEKMRKVEFVLKNVYHSDVDVNLVDYWAK